MGNKTLCLGFCSPKEILTVNETWSLVYNTYASTQHSPLPWREEDLVLEFVHLLWGKETKSSIHKHPEMGT